MKTVRCYCDEIPHAHYRWAHYPIVDQLNVARMREEAEEKEKERKLQCQLGLQLIDIGYKVLATRLHPDKGGSQEVMVRLIQVRDLLKAVLQSVRRRTYRGVKHQSKPERKKNES